MDNWLNLMYQARFYLLQHQDFIPLVFVEDVLLFGGVDRYVVASGIDINTPEGITVLNWENALYSVCLELCNLGLGNQPYRPHPYMWEPAIVVEAGADAHIIGGPHMAPPAGFEPDHVDVGYPAGEGDGVRVEGPLLQPEQILPDPILPQPVDPLNLAEPENHQHQRQQPKDETKVKPEIKNNEYVEPDDDHEASHSGKS
jgi:hypothetical protein